MSYDALERRANALAGLLRRQGVGRGDCVGLLLPRSMDVYVALLGILKAGAAYVPLDPDYPAERVSFILSDCQARALVTTGALAAKAADRTVAILLDETDLSSLPSDRPDQTQTGLRTEDLAYVIYTSGTTGKPKGVAIEHRSVCHLVRAEGHLFQVQPRDRVYQGFSIAFDASVEEIWLAFFGGASLVVGTREMVRSGPALSGLLAQAGVTVLSCVPTLLAMMEDDVPLVRLLILGGEACPPDLVRRWLKPGRRVFNTYGPTEATVIATWAECHPQKPITIGKPLSGYSAWILDSQCLPVPAGTAGELCLGGIGLARGYVGKPQLTQEKFISFTPKEGPALRLYRTGDLARWTPEGEIEFLGRIDSQVKIRGFRVELSEIEAVLLECAEIKSAAVALREDSPGLQQLVGYFVPRTAVAFDEENIRRRLRARLPGYMVPALLQPLAELPTLPSGKVDRKNLPKPTARQAEARPDIVPPASALERQIATVWEQLFAPTPVSTEDDFFLDLGGHSLLAARMISELRKSPALQQLSMADVYQHPTIRTLALELERRSQIPGGQTAGKTSTECSSKSPTAEPDSKFSPTPFWRHFCCGTAQCVSLVFVLSFFALQWLAPYLAYTVIVEEKLPEQFVASEYHYLAGVLGAFASLIVVYPFMLAISILVKWLLIGRYQPGAYPLWGSFYFRWWLTSRIQATVPVGYLAGTPLLNIYLRLMGAKIGHNVYLGSDSFAIYDLLSIGDDSSVNVDSSLPGYTIENGLLKIGPVTLGKRCFVGARAAVRQDSVMEDGSALEDLSLLPFGVTIPRGETWRGSPAEKIAQPAARTLPPAPPSASAFRRFGFGILYALGVLTFPVLVVAALFPGIVIMNYLNYINEYYWYLVLSPLVGVSFVVLLALEIAGIKWLLLGRIQPGCHQLHTFYYLRKWFVDQTMDLSLDILGPLYASVYLAPWYKLLGARLGKGAEVSTASFISPDLLSIGDESFIADSVSLGAPRVRDGLVTIGRNHIGKRSFIGNSAMLPPGTVIGDDVLIGCLSVPPLEPADALRTDSAWLGSPAMFLPQRLKSASFGDETTFHPTARLRAQRAAIEFVRVITPSTLFIILLSLMFSKLLLLHDEDSGWIETLLFFPPLYIGCGVASALLTILAKWALVWRYRPCEKPLWSAFVWRNELLNALHEHVAEPFLLEALNGTPFLCWYFRLLGARIGRRVYMETIDFSEFDLVRIGDEAALNADCTIQTHLFEDRIMKMSTIDIAPRCKVGSGSLVLYDTRMEEGAVLGDLSLLMKGEVLPAGTRWEGVPARSIGTSHPIHFEGLTSLNVP